MTKPIFTKGRRLYTTASILTILVAVMHTVGNLQPDPPEYEGVLTAMQNAPVPMGMGMEPSIYDIYWSLVFGNVAQIDTDACPGRGAATH